MRAVALLPALTGNVGVAGGGWQYANLASHCLRPLPLPPEPPADARDSCVATGAAISNRSTHRRSAPPGLNAATRPSRTRRRPACAPRSRRLDLVVVVDQFLTPTAKLAHFVLPAKTLFEEEDLVTAYWHPYLQWRARVFDPPGEVKPESEIWRLLCERFGYDTQLVPVRSAGLAAGTCCRTGTEDAIDELTAAPARPLGARRRGLRGPPVPDALGQVEFESRPKPRRGGASTRVPDYAPLDEGHASARAAGFPLQFLSCKTRDRIHSQFGNLDWVRGVERPHVLDIHPDDAQPARHPRRCARRGVERPRPDRTDRARHAGHPAGRRARARRLVPRGRSRRERAHRRGPHRHEPRRDVLRVPGGGGAPYERAASSSICIAASGAAPACSPAASRTGAWTSAAWRRVLPLNLRRYDAGPTYFLSVACHHCDEPACLQGCPSGAYEKRPDGIVVHHEDAVPRLPVLRDDLPVRRAAVRRRDRGVMSKCHLCAHRVDAGLAAGVRGGVPDRGADVRERRRRRHRAAAAVRARVRRPGRVPAQRAIQGAGRLDAGGALRRARGAASHMTTPKATPLVLFTSLAIAGAGLVAVDPVLRESCPSGRIDARADGWRRAAGDRPRGVAAAPRAQEPRAPCRPSRGPKRAEQRDRDGWRGARRVGGAAGPRLARTGAGR